MWNQKCMKYIKKPQSSLVYVSGGFLLVIVGNCLFMVTTMLLPLLIGLLGLVLASVILLFRVTDGDPARLRVILSDEETALAAKRLQWVNQTIDELARRAMVKPLRSVKYANSGIYYYPLIHRIYISRAACARISDNDLNIILAHEIGHARRRFSGWWLYALSKRWRIKEEIQADVIAMKLSGCNFNDWQRAIAAAEQADEFQINTCEFYERVMALKNI